MIKIDQEYITQKNEKETVMNTPTTVFISYSHDSITHSKTILEFSDKLIKDGINCVLDQYIQAPREGWIKWMNKNTDEADYILMMCTSEYNERIKATNLVTDGNGVRFESLLTFQELYENGSLNDKIIPVILKNCDKKHIPKALRPFQYYSLEDKNGYNDMYRFITNQPKIIKPALGEKIALETGVNIKSRYAYTNTHKTKTKTKTKVKKIELVIDKDFDTYSNDDKDQLLTAISSLLKVDGGEITIKSWRKGSVILSLEMSVVLVDKLLKLKNEGKLDYLGVSMVCADVGKHRDKKLKFRNESMVNKKMSTGTVKWFNAEKGYGFITPEDGSRDLFVHHSEIRSGGGYDTLNDGQTVEFEVGEGQTGRNATKVVPI